MPDPWFKNRHKKRRLLQPVLVQQIADRMEPGARFFVMSDVKVQPSPFLCHWCGHVSRGYELYRVRCYEVYRVRCRVAKTDRAQDVPYLASLVPQISH